MRPRTHTRGRRKRSVSVREEKGQGGVLKPSEGRKKGGRKGGKGKETGIKSRFRG